MHASNPKSVDDHPALLRPARDAHHPGAGDLGHLPGQRPGGARRGRHHHRVPWLRPADVHHSEVGGGTGRAVHRHHRQLVDHAGDDGGEHVVADDHVVLEARQRGDHVADRVRVAARRHHLADPRGPDDLAQLQRREVARLTVEPGAHGGVDPEVGVAEQRFTLGGFGRRRCDQLGVVGLDQPGRAATQQDPAVRQVGHNQADSALSSGTRPNTIDSSIRSKR